MGSVTPLLAVVEELQKVEPTMEFFWLGTKTGPEKQLVEKYGIKFQSISGGKLRRYFSWQNFLDPFRIIAGFFQSLNSLRKNKPEVILTAGAFISVPVIWAGWFLRIPIVVHQQDIRPGLANRLMAPLAKKITVTFEESIKRFPQKKTKWIGNPVRQSVLQGSRDKAIKEFNLEPELPTVLIVGGGTGALVLNQAVTEGLAELVKFCQVIHVTGDRKSEIGNQKSERYSSYEFLTDRMKDALAVADIVVSRAGLGFLTELAALGKAVILIPIKDSHQELNANYFAKQNAVLFLPQEELNAENLAATIKNLISNKSDRVNLGRNIQGLMKWGAAGEMVEVVRELTKES